MDFTIQEMWHQSSGPVKGVLLMLIVMLILCIGVAIERMIALFTARTQSRQLAAAITESMLQGNVAEAKDISDQKSYDKAYLAIMLRAGLTEFDLRQDQLGIDAVERALEKQFIDLGQSLRRGFNVLATTGATAPFVGLVGTIFGIINAFSHIGAEGGADLTTLAPAIGEALITTAFGIMVAIVGVWLFNYFNSLVEAITNEVTMAAQELVDWCHKQIDPPVSEEPAAK
jgi:biopolymer transport protein ExbB/TolQ